MEIESGLVNGLQIIFKWAVAPIAVVAWWFFRKTHEDINIKLHKQHQRTDNLERRMSSLEKTQAVIEARLEYIVETSKDTRRVLEKLDDKLDKNGTQN